MRVAIDARAVYAPNRRGTGKNLIDLYATLAALRPSWEFVMLHQREGAENPFERQQNIRPMRIDMPGDRFDLWQEVRLPIGARQARADVLHCPANLAPRFAATAMVVTIHDLIPLEMAPSAPQTRDWARRVKRAARYARRIITPSQYTRQRLVSQFAEAPEKIVVNPWAADRSCQRVTAPAALERVRQAYGVAAGRPFVLAFGAEDPRKNTARILEAWSRVPEAVRSHANLVVVGLQPHALERYSRLADDIVSDGTCLLHGFADEADIPVLLSAARALCYPSLSEGFGLPVLDAFACETAVITSATTSLPEVAGEAALLVEPTDVAAIAAALADVLQSDALCRQLSDEGRRRLTVYSWQRCAETAAGVLEAAAA